MSTLLQSSPLFHGSSIRTILSGEGGFMSNVSTWLACLQPSATLKKTFYGRNPKHKIKRVACTQSHKTKRLSTSGLGESTVSSWLGQHLLSPAGKYSRVNSTNSHTSAFSVYILRDAISSISPSRRNQTTCVPHFQSRTAGGNLGV